MRQVAKLVLTVTVLAAGAAVARAQDGQWPPAGGPGHPKPLRGQERKAAGHLFRAADADRSHDVSADEWTAVLGALGADATGAVSLDALADALLPDRANGDESADTTRRDAKLVRLFDQDGDGVVELSDLEVLFDLADANADGSLGGAELRPRR